MSAGPRTSILGLESFTTALSSSHGSVEEMSASRKLFAAIFNTSLLIAVFVQRSVASKYAYVPLFFFV